DGKYIGLISEGECLGETGFVNGGAHKHRVEALTSVNALVLSADVMAELPPKIHLHYYRHISEILVSRTTHADFSGVDIEL
ncbi:MAG: CRP-like cAMP-binding protein, partial [Flavobacteriaceae bacterium]